MTQLQGPWALNLNMARGKPGRDQLDLVTDILDGPHGPRRTASASGIDARNYGELAGLPAARALLRRHPGLQARRRYSPAATPACS